ALGLVAALAVGVAATGYFLYLARDQAEVAVEAKQQAEKERGSAVQARQVAEGAKTIAEQAQESEKAQRRIAEHEHDRAEWLVYAGQLAQAQGAWEANDVAGAWEHLDATRWDFRGWEYRHLATLFTSNQRIIRGHTQWVLSVCFSPDGQRLASASF